MDEPISRRGGTWLVLLLVLAIMAAFGWAAASVGGGAVAGFGQLGTGPGAASSNAECFGCGSQRPASGSGAAASAPGSAAQAAAPVQGTAARSVATGGRAAAPVASAPAPVAPAPAAAAVSSGGLCGTIGRTGPPLLQTVLSPVAAVCDILL